MQEIFSSSGVVWFDCCTMHTDRVFSATSLRGMGFLLSPVEEVELIGTWGPWTGIVGVHYNTVSFGVLCGVGRYYRGREITMRVS